jgi:oxaloacetate decarboxylase (Na+ extruding) subunit gamma
VLLQGLTLTIVGMSVVFIFLTILVFVMKFMSAFIPKYFPDAISVNQSNPKSTKKESIENVQGSMEIADKAVLIGEAEIAAIIAAVKSYSNILKG